MIAQYGFRSTFRIFCAEQTSYPRELPELALGHSVLSAVEAAYQRSTLLEKRRDLMQQYADYCDTIQRRPLKLD